MPRSPYPTANARIPGTATYVQQLITPARPDGTRLRTGLYGPVHRKTGTCWWTECAVENPDGTTRRAWSRRYSRKNLTHLRQDYTALEEQVYADPLHLPGPLREYET